MYEFYFGKNTLHMVSTKLTYDAWGHVNHEE